MLLISKYFKISISDISLAIITVTLPLFIAIFFYPNRTYPTKTFNKLCSLFKLLEYFSGFRETDSRGSRRGSGESGRAKNQGERKHNCRHHRRRQSQQSQQSMDSGSGVMPVKYYRSDQRPSASSTDSAASNAVRYITTQQSDSRGSDFDCDACLALSLSSAPL